MEPDLVNVKVEHLREDGYQSLMNWLTASPNHVYIGRTVPDVLGAKASKWRNPYSIKKYGSAKEACKKYKEYILRSPELLKSLKELSGKTLGCWCVPDHECHGQVLIELFRQHVGTPRIPLFE